MLFGEIERGDTKWGNVNPFAVEISSDNSFGLICVKYDVVSYGIARNLSISVGVSLVSLVNLMIILSTGSFEHRSRIIVCYIGIIW